MKSVEYLLSELEMLDVQLSIADGRLRCNAPRGIMTTALRDSIKQYKPDLLRSLENRKNTAASGGDRTFPSITREGELPLSFSQQRIWLLSKLDSDCHLTGNIYFAFRIEGALDVPALEKTLNTIIQRHEVFRVGCDTVNQRPVQTISPEANIKLPMRDFRQLSAQEKQTTLAATVKQYAQEPFDLAKAPILRAGLLRLDDREHIFLLATHLYLFDGWSTAVLFKEISALYAAFQNQEPSLLSPMTAQYVDFAHWHCNWFEGKEAAKQNAYWKEKLKDTRLVTALPIDRPRQAKAPSINARIEFALPGFLTEAIRNLSQQAGTTLFISLMAAFQTLLYGYTRQEKLATGTIVSNRRVADSENMIGSFANNILIASDFYCGITFNDLLDQVRNAAREAYANQDMPFEHLLGALNPNLTNNPLFRVMFVLHQHQSIHNQGLALAGLRIEKLPELNIQSKYDLELVMVDRDGSLSGLFEYNAGLFDRTTIESVKDNFFLVLKQVTTHPGLVLDKLPFFQKNEQPSVTTGNETKTGFVAPRTPLESTLARIWQALFGFGNIGVHDRFTDLGGHSLLAVRLMAVLKEEFQVDIEPVSLFEFPTIAQLSVFIDGSGIN